MILFFMLLPHFAWAVIYTERLDDAEHSYAQHFNKCSVRPASHVVG